MNKIDKIEWNKLWIGSSLSLFTCLTGGNAAEQIKVIRQSRGNSYYSILTNIIKKKGYFEAFPLKKVKHFWQPAPCGGQIFLKLHHIGSINLLFFWASSSKERGVIRSISPDRPPLLFFCGVSRFL